MATIIPNTFTTYLLSKEELLHGTILTTVQKQCVQNQIAYLAEQKLSLKYLPETPNVFLQQEAELQGQIIALKYLISLSENAEAEVNQSAINL